MLDRMAHRDYAHRSMRTANPPEPVEPELPPRPERPDCCAGGCATCVLDGYFEEVQRWEEQVAQIRARHAAGQAAPE